MDSEILPPIQANAATWYGPEMEQRRQEWEMRLAPGEIQELEAAAATLLASGQNIAAIAAADFPLPSLAPKLIALREKLVSGCGFALVKGLPIANYSPQTAGTIFYGLGCHLGSPRSQNAMGHTLGHVRDLGLSSNDPNVRIYQTNERQTFHTDSADVVGLLCLNKAKEGGASLLVSASAIFNEMRRQRPDLLELLLQPIATDRRGEVPAGMLPYLLIPVFSYYEGYLTVFLPAAIH